MDKVEDGGPAFPVVAEGGEGSGLHPDRWDGMTLRDYFAGQALAGMIASHDWTKNIALESKRDNVPAVYALSKAAYFAADAMLLARKAGDQS